MENGTYPKALVYPNVKNITAKQPRTTSHASRPPSGKEGVDPVAGTGCWASRASSPFGLVGCFSTGKSSFELFMAIAIQFCRVELEVRNQNEKGGVKLYLGESTVVKIKLSNACFLPG
jgi:hypothetical protein